MAEALAKQKWPSCRVKSVGINVLESGAPAAAQAIEVMGKRGLDITGHKATSICDVDVRDFQFVICLSKRVRCSVTKLPGVIESTIKSLFVDDPFQNDIEQYEKRANTIADGLKNIGF